MRRGLSSIVFVLIVTVALLFIPCRIAHAGNTTVVISASIGGGVAVGMVGWFIHLTYSQRVARAHPPSHELSAKTGTQGEVLGLDGLRTQWNRNEVTTPSTFGVKDSEGMPPQQTAFIRFVELPW